MGVDHVGSEPVDDLAQMASPRRAVVLDLGAAHLREPGAAVGHHIAHPGHRVFEIAAAEPERDNVRGGQTTDLGMRLVGGLLFFCSYILMIVNLWATIRSGVKSTSRVKVVSRPVPATVSSWRLLGGSPVVYSLAIIVIAVLLGVSGVVTSALALALLVTGGFQVPLFHQLYPGNQPDAPTFRSLIDELVRRYQILTDGALDVTLVFDKGNNAADTIEAVAESPYHVVGSLVPTHHPELLAIRENKLKPLDAETFPGGVTCHRTQKEVFGREYTVLVTFNEMLFTAQTKTIEREVGKRRLKLKKYQLFLERFSGPRWETLADRGARVQRPLWASTSTKNPAYPDTLYVDQLIGPDTVNTLPDATLDAFEDRGVVARTLDADPDAARAVLDRLAQVGVDLVDATDTLEVEGVATTIPAAEAILETTAMSFKCSGANGWG